MENGNFIEKRDFDIEGIKSFIKHMDDMAKNSKWYRKTPKKILIVVSHPDDELLGGGATYRKHVLVGDEVHCLILGEGAVMHGITTHAFMLQSLDAGKIIGFTNMYFENMPDNMMDTIPLLDVTKIIERYIKEIQPDIIYTHHFGDLNIDHRITFQAVLTACRPGCSTVKEIYCFETPSSTEWAFDGSFKPNVFVEITYAELDTKIKALQCYTTEIRPYPHPRSIAGLRTHAEFYGIMAGVKLAEAFELVRCLK
jgi:LmbE family N-acetylglucosaminyl deacetylase